MEKQMIITIGRESGSGGKHIGEMLAEKLGIKFYDKELLTIAAKSSGLCEEIFELHDEKPTSSFLFSLVNDTYSLNTNYTDMPLNQRAFLAQFDTIKKIAEEESCVIIGRCADYALANHPNLLSVFITGNVSDKILYLMDYYSFSESKAKEYMVKTDKQRASYYNFYSDKRWGSSKSYDICINSSLLGYEGTADFLAELARRKFKADA